MHSIAGIEINPSIKKEVEQHIVRNTESESMPGGLQLYKNAVGFEYFENDKLVVSTLDSSRPIRMPFKSFYLWRGDTLSIDGAIGMFGGTGFTISIAKGSSHLYHMLASDDFPSYAYGAHDSLQWRLEVPCTDTKIILSALPDSVKKPLIYGYVEFKSREYYVVKSMVDGKETEPRTKARANMKIYFVSGMLTL